MFASLRTLAASLIAAIVLALPTLASAQGNSQFKDHYQEFFFQLNPGQTSYLQIPRQGWPIGVQVSVTDPNNNMSVAVTSFVVVDSAVGNGTMTAATTPINLISTSCYVGSSDPNGLYECSVNNNLIMIGNTDLNSVQPHKLYIRANSLVQVRVTMWY